MRSREQLEIALEAVKKRNGPFLIKLRLDSVDVPCEHI